MTRSRCQLQAASPRAKPVKHLYAPSTAPCADAQGITMHGARVKRTQLRAPKPTPRPSHRPRQPLPTPRIKTPAVKPLPHPEATREAAV